MFAQVYIVGCVHGVYVDEYFLPVGCIESWRRDGGDTQLKVNGRRVKFEMAK